MASREEQKERISRELAEARLAISQSGSQLCENLNIGKHLRTSIHRHSFLWATAAAIFGWILSRLPARKKKVYIESSGPGTRRRKKKGLGAKFWSGLWSFSKPLLTAYLTKKLAERTLKGR
jgi:hypothetical protein